MLTNTIIYRDGNCGRGSVGGFFTMSGDNTTIYGISNNHVIANINNCNVDDAIYSANGTIVGSLSHWIPLSKKELNYYDVALLKYTNTESYSWRLPVPNITKPLGFIEPLLDGHVYMMLENNHQRLGYISASSINYTVNFLLCGVYFPFTQIIEITPFEIPFSVPGESGSIVMSSNHCIVGLLIGTNKDKIISYAIPFVNGILNYLPLLI